ncbi:Uncharacterised protein [Yersinia rohdei]|uniref:Uncharacterized protein n=1 Tax=Yersinia rohdei TaxID=29485 RepID=A0A0U1HWQ6_YERRO|nr:Uncharacterised protein [Yersinia rohdei]
MGISNHGFYRIGRGTVSQRIISRYRQGTTAYFCRIVVGDKGHLRVAALAVYLCGDSKAAGQRAGQVGGSHAIGIGRRAGGDHGDAITAGTEIDYCIRDGFAERIGYRRLYFIGCCAVSRGIIN